MFIKEIIQFALNEDIGTGDHSTLLSVPENAQGKAKLLVKEEGIIAGVDVAKQIFEQVDNTLNLEIFIQDGQPVHKGDIVFIVSGKIRSILSTERLVLNVMQRMSGIATTTHYYNSLIKGTSARILDTRKTTPNLRLLEKMAVKIGGGTNHRMGLYDMIMLKDNHIDFAGGLENALRKAKEYIKTKNLPIKIEIETRSLEDVKTALEIGGFDIIMFDNFTPEEVQKAVKLVANHYQTEASGGITETTIRDYAQTGVDFISVGALTNSVKSLDLSLKAILD